MNRTRLVLVGAAFLFALGCSEPTTGTITGMVLIDGKPAETGAVTLIPVSRKGRTAGSEIIDGRYSAVASLGEMRVEIRVPVVVGQKKLYDAPDSPVRPLMEERLPPRYNDQSELTVEIVPGETEHDFKLTTE